MDTINWWFAGGALLAAGLFVLVLRMSGTRRDPGRQIHGVDFDRHKGKEQEKR